MFCVRVRSVLMFLALLASLSVSLVESAGGGQAKDDPAAKDEQVVKSKGVKKAAAAAVNFRKELGLPFDSLSTLGSRIDAARRKPDPVALAHQAQELAVAEKVSGKQASITSQQLIQESAELAKVRKQEAELRAVIQVANQLSVQEYNLNLLQKELDAAKAQVKAEKEARDRQLEPTWKPRTVVVNNYTTQYLDIYVNGTLKGQVQPGMQQTFVIEHRWNPTVLTAYGNEDTHTWGPRYIWGRFDKYTWNIE